MRSPDETRISLNLMVRRLHLCAVILAAACGSIVPQDPTDVSTSSADPSGTGSTTETPTGGASSGMDLPPALPDGDPTRLPCTNEFGDALSSAYGRLDGILVAVVPLGEDQCNGDQDHLHLQVRANGQIYDVAMNMNVRMLANDAPRTGDPWTEGWHPGVALDYVGTLATHSSDFTAYAKDALAQHIEDLTTTINHISVYGTGYGPDGMHKIHRNFTNNDGAVVLDPLSNTPTYLLFHFDNQSF